MLGDVGSFSMVTYGYHGFLSMCFSESCLWGASCDQANGQLCLGQGPLVICRIPFRRSVPFQKKKSAEFYRILQKLDSGGGQAARSPWAGPRDRKISKAGVGQCMAMSFAKLTFSRLLCDFRLYNRTYRSCFDSTRAFEYAACHESADGEAI
jgi:hypothetical protein